MTSRFEGRAAAWRVAGVAVTDTIGIVSPGAASEGRSGMTGGAIQIGRDVVEILAGRGNTMAGSTIVHNAGMIEGCRDEALRVMTDTAILIGINMIA